MTAKVDPADVNVFPRVPRAESVSAGDSARAIATWLFEGGAQAQAEPHAGGVAGWLDDSGRAEYLYPEITGYYLQWLAWVASCDGVSAHLVRRAAAAQRWLTSWIGRTDPPETRVYLCAHGRDWRNDALFFFDLAMVLRGIASAARARLIDPDPGLVREGVTQLSRLIGADGMFDPFRACIPGESVPKRWSTQRGGFLAKGAAGILAAGTTLPEVDSRLRNAAAATMTASLDAAIGQPHDETHPALYAIEGALGLQNRRVATLLPAFTNQIDMLLTHAAVDGGLPESRGSPGVKRLDVVAQALRAAVLLRARCVDWSPDPQALEKMRSLLVRNIGLDGSIPFAPGAAIPQYSVWCAMFAEQALRISGPAVPHSRLNDLEAYLV